MPIKNCIGNRYGYIEVLEKTSKRKRNYVVYKCKCHKCGKIVEKTLEHLQTRKNQGFDNMTCGCFNRHHNNFYKNGLSNTRLRHIYANMKSRCYNKNNKGYNYYGGRGIKICEEWLEDFENFYNWAIGCGYKENLTIERINVNGDYEPNNCKWADVYEQMNNRTNTIKLKYKDTTKSLTEWAREYNIEIATLRTRISRGWSVERALNEKTHLNYKGKKNNE